LLRLHRQREKNFYNTDTWRRVGGFRLDGHDFQLRQDLVDEVGNFRASGVAALLVVAELLVPSFLKLSFFVTDAAAN
jgi:hypothetical protein